jgi:thymidine phosphorylase
MLRLTGRAATIDEGKKMIVAALDEGRALGVLELIVRQQGGDPRILVDRSLLPHAPSVEPWKSPSDGHLRFADVRAVGLAVAALGGGRTKITDSIDPAVGLVWRRGEGEMVKRGDVLCEIHHRDGRGLEACRALLEKAVALAGPFVSEPLVRAHVSL